MEGALFVNRLVMGIFDMETVADWAEGGANKLVWEGYIFVVLSGDRISSITVFF